MLMGDKAAQARSRQRMAENVCFTDNEVLFWKLCRRKGWVLPEPAEYVRDGKIRHA